MKKKEKKTKKKEGDSSSSEYSALPRVTSLCVTQTTRERVSEEILYNFTRFTTFWHEHSISTGQPSFSILWSSSLVKGKNPNVERKDRFVDYRLSVLDSLKSSHEILCFAFYEILTGRAISHKVINQAEQLTTPSIK